MPEKSEKEEEAIYKVDTVPPPDGESDAYNAPTRIGAAAPEVLAALRAAGVPQELLAGMESLPPSAEPGSGERESEAADQAVVAASAVATGTATRPPVPRPSTPLVVAVTPAAVIVISAETPSSDDLPVVAPSVQPLETPPSQGPPDAAAAPRPVPETPPAGAEEAPAAVEAQAQAPATEAPPELAAAEADAEGPQELAESDLVEVPRLYDASEDEAPTRLHEGANFQPPSNAPTSLSTPPPESSVPPPAPHDAPVATSTSVPPPPDQSGSAWRILSGLDAPLPPPPPTQMTPMRLRYAVLGVLALLLLWLIVSSLKK